VKLNVGCGTDIRPGWINLDSVALPGVDVCHDLNDMPLPFESNSLDQILCQDILEHIHGYPRLLKDLHRILKPGGVVDIRVPHFTSKDAYSDPTHVRLFSVWTFVYFSSQHTRNYYFDFAFSELRVVHVCFDRRLGYPWNYLLEPLVNLSRTAQNVYEGSPLRVFPATNLLVTLVK